MQIAGIKIIMGIGLRPWSINLVSVDWGPHNWMECCKTAGGGLGVNTPEDEAMVMDTFDAIDFLNNNNKDLLSQAMEIADISW